MNATRENGRSSRERRGTSSGEAPRAPATAWASKECVRVGRARVGRREREARGGREGVPDFVGRERGDERAPGASRRSSMASMKRGSNGGGETTPLTRGRTDDWAWGHGWLGGPGTVGRPSTVLGARVARGVGVDGSDEAGLGARGTGRGRASQGPGGRLGSRG